MLPQVIYLKLKVTLFCSFSFKINKLYFVTVEAHFIKNSNNNYLNYTKLIIKQVCHFTWKKMEKPGI